MHIKSIMERQHALNKLSHLYMIVGPKGHVREDVLKHSIETILEKKFSKLEDALLSTRVYHLTAEQTIIKKEQVLELQEEFSKTSLESGYRMFIVEDIDQLNISSANSLLKFLEEPSGKNTIGILCTNKPQAILDTIKSRAQIMYLRATSDEDLKKTLLESGLKEPDISYMLMIKDVFLIATRVENPLYIDAMALLKRYVDALSKDKKLDNLLMSSSFLASDLECFEFFTALIYHVFLDILKYPHLIAFSHFNEQYKRIKEVITYEMLTDALKKIEQIQLESRYFVSLDMLRRRLIHILNEYI